METIRVTEGTKKTADAFNRNMPDDKTLYFKAKDLAILLTNYTVDGTGEIEFNLDEAIVTVKLKEQ